MTVTKLLARLIARIALLDLMDHLDPDSSAFERSLEDMSGHGGLIRGFILAAIVTAPVWVPILILRRLWDRLSNR
jgi:hypothetical protein